MCFIFSSLLLPAENLHYRQVVLLKGNLMVVVERGKRVCYSLPSQRHVPSGPSSETLAHTPHSRLYSAVTVHTSVTDGWDIICGYVIFFFFFFKYYLKTFLGGGKPWREGRGAAHRVYVRTYVGAGCAGLHIHGCTCRM